jgi:hypothetical protein
MKYPKQNYLSTTGTPEGRLWLDGFRSIEGAVRQYILTAEKMRGVASNVIGKDRVYAIGISFFLSKEKKDFLTVPPITPNFGNQYNYGGAIITNNVNHPPQFYSPVHTPIHWKGPSSSSSSFGGSTSCASSSSSSVSSGPPNRRTRRAMSKKRGGRRKGAGGQARVISTHGGVPDMDQISLVQAQLAETVNDPNLQITAHHAYCVQEVETKNLEVGAGASIDQQVYDDPEQLSFWRDEPEAIICVNYALEEEVAQIIAQGSKSLEGHKEGFLQNVPVGN